MIRFCKTPSRFLHAQVYMHLLWMHQVKHKSQNREEPRGEPSQHPSSIQKHEGIYPGSPSFPASVQGLHYLLAVLMQDHCPPDSWPPGQTCGSRVLMGMGSGKVHSLPWIRSTTDGGWLSTWLGLFESSPWDWPFSKPISFVILTPFLAEAPSATQMEFCLLAGPGSLGWEAPCGGDTLPQI